MNYFLRISLVLFLFLTNKTYSQTVETETLEKSNFIISSSNENITSAQLNVYKTAVNNYANLDEFRFLNERRIIEFEKDLITLELFSANELAEKYGKEVPASTIIPGSNYLPVKFQLINWENTYTIHPLFDKSNELTH